MALQTRVNPAQLHTGSTCLVVTGDDDNYLSAEAQVTTYVPGMSLVEVELTKVRKAGKIAARTFTDGCVIAVNVNQDVYVLRRA